MVIIERPDLDLGPSGACSVEIVRYVETCSRGLLQSAHNYTQVVFILVF